MSFDRVYSNDGFKEKVFIICQDCKAHKATIQIDDSYFCDKCQRDVFVEALCASE